MTSGATTPRVLERLVAHAQQIYSLPAVALQVLDLTSQPEIDTLQLKQCIENDPALTARILRVANSSLFALSGEVHDLNQALALLGTNRLKLLVLGFSLPKQLFRGVEAEVLGRYWRHALTKAVAARQLSRLFEGLPGDEAFVAGLLQDLGILVLIQQLGEPYVQLLNRVYHDEGSLPAWESSTLGFNHWTLTAELLEHWGMPSVLVEAVAATEEGEELSKLDGPQRALAQTLQLAELLAQLLAHRHLSRLRPLLDTGWRYCRLTVDKLEAIVTTVVQEVQELAEVLSLQLPGELNYVDVLAEAHRQLADTVEQLAVGLPGDADLADSLLKQVQSIQATARSGLASAASSSQKKSSTAVRGHAAGQPRRPYVAAPTPASAEAELDGALVERVAEAIGACRQRRCPLSLILVQPKRRSEAGREELSELVAAAIEDVFEGRDKRIELAGGGFAVVVQDCDRLQAVQLARQLVAVMETHNRTRCPKGSQTVAVSIGLASLSLPPRSFPPQELIQAAERCLHAAGSAAGSAVKSIEIY